ncbi:high affinity immunoglobulin gamma Fc receptor I [Carassius gibelio]|uniref:high affinity immunoglobulin gamma Fc receptor I n=1 Tax=Carassius gibelio TaxID=101364 RepID=UPI002279308C|nr:high affinity immunoglobulin gamma Fc receptor I [Carassius gibelio]
MDMRSLLTLSVLLALIRGNKGQKPIVTLRPKFPQVYAGDDITLICNREGGSKPTTWYFNGAPQTHKDYLMLLTAVTPDNNGVYECEQGGMKSDPFTLTVLDLEPHAQLSPSFGGAVMTKGDGRNLVLQTDDDDLENWNCYVLRGVSTFLIVPDINKDMKRVVIFAELKEAERATFWCKKNTTVLRSNAVTLKMTELMVMLVPPAVPALKGENLTLRCEVWGKPKLDKAVFYKNNKSLPKSSPEDTYTITNATQSDNGMYSCHATYRFTHISAGAAKKDGDADAQELKVIGGPPAAVISASANSLKCSCPDCPASCTSYHWYHTPFNDPFTREKRSENDESITVEKEGEYRCRRDCGNGFSRFSHVYSYKEQPVKFGHMWYILVPALILFVIIIVLIIVLKYRRCGRMGIQAPGRDADQDTLMSVRYVR